MTIYQNFFDIFDIRYIKPILPIYQYIKNKVSLTSLIKIKNNNYMYISYQHECLLKKKACRFNEPFIEIKLQVNIIKKNGDV